MSVLSVVNGKTKGRLRQRFEKRPDDLTRDGERVRDRKRTLSQQLARRDTTNTEHQKGPKS